MYIAAGIGIILPGLIAKLIERRVKNNHKRGWVNSNSMFDLSTLIGVGAVITNTSNPFAYLIISIGISLLVPTLLIKKEIK